MLDKFRTGAKSFGVMLIFGIIIVVFVFWGVGSFNAPSSRTLAEINGAPITIEDFRQPYVSTMTKALEEDPALLRQDDRIKQIKRMVLEDLVKSKALMQAAEKIGIVVAPQEIRKALDTIPEFHNAEGKFDKDIFQRVLASQRISQDSVLDEIAENITQRKLMLYVQLSAGVNEAEEKSNYMFALEKRKAQYVLFSPDDYRAKVELSDEDLRKDYESRLESFRAEQMVSLEYLPLTPESLGPTFPVSDAEVEEYYQKNKESFRKPERVLARHIFVSYPIGDEHGRPISREDQDKGAREIMDKALAAIKEGEDFSTVAALYSHDQQSAQNGGLLDWIMRGDIPIKEFEDAAFSLKLGEISDIVVSSQGLHLIQIEAREDERLPDLAESKDSIITTLGMKKADAELANIFKEAEDSLALGTPIAEIAAKLKVAVRQTGMATQVDAENQLALRDDSRQLLRDAVATMIAAGKSTEPTQSNSTAAVAHAPGPIAPRELPVPINIEKGIALVRINEAAPSHIRPFEDVRDGIETRLKDEKSLALARQAAEAALPTFSGQAVPEAFKDKVEMSKDGARAFPILEPFGTAPQLIEGIFSSRGEWLPQVYDTTLGPVIARSASVDKVTPEEWERWKDIFMPQRHEFRRNQMLQAFMDGLDDTLVFTINANLLDSLPSDFR